MPPKKLEEKASDYKSPVDDDLIRERNRINSVKISIEVFSTFLSSFRGWKNL